MFAASPTDETELGLILGCIASSFMQPAELIREQRELSEEANAEKGERVQKERRKMRGRSKLAVKLKRKRKNVIDAQTLQLRRKLDEEKHQKQESAEAKGQNETPVALRRFTTASK